MDERAPAASRVPPEGLPRVCEGGGRVPRRPAGAGNRGAVRERDDLDRSRPPRRHRPRRGGVPPPEAREREGRRQRPRVGGGRGKVKALNGRRCPDRGEGRAGPGAVLVREVRGDVTMAERALLLLSGGIDSPVAGHMIARQGLEVLAVHFSLEPITDDAAAVKSRKLAERLGLSRLFVVIVGPAFAEIAKACDLRLYFVLSKRLMVRIAEAIARREGCAYLLTGESLGQVSSQTLQNLRAIDAAASMVVLRPLIGFDKEETVRIAREIGTFTISEGPEICDLLGPAHPATKASLDQVLAEEAVAA